MIAYTCNILLAPAGTPRATIDRLSTTIANVMTDNRFVDTLVKLGVDPVTDSDPDKAAAMIAAELTKWRPIIQALQLGGDGPVRSASPGR